MSGYDDYKAELSEYSAHFRQAYADLAAIARLQSCMDGTDYHGYNVLHNACLYLMDRGCYTAWMTRKPSPYALPKHGTDGQLCYRVEVI